MLQRFLTLALMIASSAAAFAQQNLKAQLDSLLATGTGEFNGVVLVAQQGKTLYKTARGYADVEKKTTVKTDDQFIIGSISKQITAVLILREYEQGRLRLDVPLSNYLPHITYNWADSITILHLLTHMSGVRQDRQSPLVFAPGSKFDYSNTGYNLLADVIAQTSGKTYAAMAEDLFKKCGMENTFHPATKKHERLVTGYEQNDSGIVNEVTKESRYMVAVSGLAAAGGIISTATDLVKWNRALHGGKLLADSTYKLMTTPYPNAIREHPLFGRTEYGCGITVNNQDELLRLGQTGKLRGYNSINFYFPETGMSMIVLNNIDLAPADIKKGFYYHGGVERIVRRYLLANKKK